MVNFVFGTASKDPRLKEYGKLKAKIILTLTPAEMLRFSRMERLMLRMATKEVNSGRPVRVCRSGDAAPLYTTLDSLGLIKDVDSSELCLADMFLLEHNQRQSVENTIHDFTIGLYA